jgi:hypothetical protein
VIPLYLPHQEPIKFASYILSKTEYVALVHTEFPSIPSLGMMIEAAAQSSGAFAHEDTKLGFLAAVKNIELIQKPLKTQYIIQIEKKYDMNPMHLFDFSILDETAPIASGSFTIIVS